MSAVIFCVYLSRGNICLLRQSLFLSKIKSELILVRNDIIISSYIQEYEGMDTVEIKNIADHATELLKVLSNSTRLMIVCRLIEGEMAVGELADALGIRPSTVSQHLQVLRLSDLVSTRRDGQTIYYSLANSALEDIIGALHKNFCVALPRSVLRPSDSKNLEGSK